MKFGKVLIYFAVLVALASYVYFVEIRYKQEQQVKKSEAEKLIHVDREKIEQVDLVSKGGSRIEMKKLGGSWLLASPVKVKADDDTVRGLLTTIANAQYEKVVLDKDVKWAEYGLDKPKFTVSVVTKADDKENKYEILFGENNPAKSSYYLRIPDDPRLLLVADTLKNALDKKLFDVRDKTVLGIAPDDVDKIVISKKGQETEFKRESRDKWLMLKPEKTRVKSEEISSELVALTNLKAKEIIDDPKKEGDPYGLANPEEAILLSGKKRDQTLLIGQAVKKDGASPRAKPDRYAAVKDQDMVFVIEGRSAGFRTDPDMLRDRYVFRFNPADVDKIEVEIQGEKWIAARNKEKKWDLEAPKQKKDLEAWPITGILWDLKSLEWKSLAKPIPEDLAPLHLDKPQLTVSLSKSGDNEPIVLKAGWAPDAPTKIQESAKPESAEPALPEKGVIEAGKKPDTNSTKQGASPETAEKTPTPRTVNALASPAEEKGAVFVLDGSFVTRLQADLQRLMEKTK